MEVSQKQTNQKEIGMNEQSRRNFFRGIRRSGPAVFLVVGAIGLLLLTAGCNTHKEPLPPTKVKTGKWHCERVVQSLEEARRYDCIGDYKTVRPL